MTTVDLAIRGNRLFHLLQKQRCVAGLKFRCVITRTGKDHVALIIPLLATVEANGVADNVTAWLIEGIDGRCQNVQLSNVARLQCPGDINGRPCEKSVLDFNKASGPAKVD